MASKVVNANRRSASAVTDRSPSSSKESSSNEKNAKSSKKDSKSNSKEHEDKSRKRKKKQHKSKRDDSKEKSPNCLLGEEKKLSKTTTSLYDEFDEKVLNSNGVVKNDLSLSHSPPPVLPTILRQSSQSRTTSIEQMIPTSVLRSQKQNETKISVEHPATKMFEEQLALLDAKSSNSTTINNWEQSSGSEEDEQIERICRMNNTKTISGPIQFKLNRTHHLPLKQSPAANETTNTEDESQPTKKKRTDESEPTFSSTNNSNEKLEQLSNNQNQENPTELVTKTDDSSNVNNSNSNEQNLQTEPTSSTNIEKKSNDENDDDRRSRSSSDSSSRRGGRRRSRRRSSYRRHRRRRRRRRHSTSSSSRSSYTSSSSDSSRSSTSRSRSSRSSSRSSSSSRDRRRRRHSSRSSSRSYSRRRSSTSSSSYSSRSSRSSRSRSSSRSRNRKSPRRSNTNHLSSSMMNGKGRGAMSRRGRAGLRNGGRGRRTGSQDNMHRQATTANPHKFNSAAVNTVRKLPGNKSTKVLHTTVPKSLNTQDTPVEPITTFPVPSSSMMTATNSPPMTMSTGITTIVSNDDVKIDPNVSITNQNLARPTNQKKNGKGKNKQQTPAYSVKRDDHDDMDQGDGEPLIGPKLPPEFEKRANKEHSFTPPDMDDPENSEMLKELKYRAEIHAAKNHGLISESEAQQLIDQHETRKQLAELPIISMPILQSQTISPMGPFLLAAAPTPSIATYQLPMATAAVAAAASAPTLTSSPDNSALTSLEQQQSQLQQQNEQQLSPNSTTSNTTDQNGNSVQTTAGCTNTAVLTPDGQTMMIQTSANVSPQLVQIPQQNQPLYMPMQTAVQQPRVVAIRTPQGGIQHFLEYPTAQLLQAQQAQQQPQFIQHNGQLMPVLRPQIGYSSAALIQQLQMQQQQQVLAAQLQAQQLAAMQQPGGAILLQNSSGQLVLAQPNPQAMRVVQLPYIPK